MDWSLKEVPVDENVDLTKDPHTFWFILKDNMYAQDGTEWIKVEAPDIVTAGLLFHAAFCEGKKNTLGCVAIGEDNPRFRPDENKGDREVDDIEWADKANRPKDQSLADLVNQITADKGNVAKILDIWKKATDKKAVEDMFEFLTNTSFSEFVQDCI